MLRAEFIGVPTATLQQWFSDAQNTLQLLMLGKNVVTAAYTQGDGAKSVTMTPADIQMVRQRVNDLGEALGLVCRTRRAISIRY